MAKHCKKRYCKAQSATPRRQSISIKMERNETKAKLSITLEGTTQILRWITTPLILCAVSIWPSVKELLLKARDVLKL